MRLKVSSNLGPKGWKPEDCPYRLCKVFVQDIGFLEKTTWKKYSFKLLKASWKCYTKFDTLRLGNLFLSKEFALISMFYYNTPVLLEANISLYVLSN